MKNGKEKVLVAIAILIVVILGIAIAVTNYIKTDNYQIKKHLEQGNQYINDSDFESAIPEYLAVVNIDDTNVEAYMKIAEAYHNLEDFEKEKKILKVGYNKTEDIEIKEYLDKILEAERVQEANDSEKITEGVVKGNTEENDEPRRRNLAIDAYYEFLSKPYIDWNQDDAYGTYGVYSASDMNFSIFEISSSEYPMMIVENPEADHLSGGYKLYGYIDGEVKDITPDSTDIIGYYGDSGLVYFGYGVQGYFTEWYYVVDPINVTCEFVASRSSNDEDEIGENAFKNFHISNDGDPDWTSTDNATKEEFDGFIREKTGNAQRIFFTSYAGWLYESNGIIYRNNSESRELLLGLKDK